MGYRFFSECDTEVIIKRLHHAWGARCVERFYGMFAFAGSGSSATAAARRHGARPARHQAALSRRHQGRPALRIHVAGPPRGGRRRHLDRPGGTAPLHDVPRRGAGAAHASQGRAQKLPPATILTIEPDGTRREETYWDLHRRRAVRGSRHAGRGVARRRPRHDQDRGRTPAHRRRCGRRALVRRARQLARWSRCSPKSRRVARPQDLLDRLRDRGRRRGRRIPLFGSSIAAAVRDRAPSHPHRSRPRTLEALPEKLHRGDVGTDGQPRCDRRLLSPVRAKSPST